MLIIHASASYDKIRSCTPATRYACDVRSNLKRAALGDVQPPLGLVLAALEIIFVPRADDARVTHGLFEQPIEEALLLPGLRARSSSRQSKSHITSHDPRRTPPQSTTPHRSDIARSRRRLPPPARVHRQRPRARRLLDAFASPRSRPRAHARAFAHTSHRSRDRRSRAVNPHHPNPRRRRPRRRHRARTWLARFFPCTRCVRAFAAFTTTLVALTANMRSIASSSSAGAHARGRGRRRAGTCVHSPTQTYVMRIGAVCVSRRDGAHVRSRDHLGWVNHLPWVVMVISNHLVVM